MPKIDVIIPLYKPGKELFTLLSRLQQQTLPINRIWLINTEKHYFDELVRGSSFSNRFGSMVEVSHISAEEFDHGGTRHRAISRSDADIVVFMTQDALPADKNLIKALVHALEPEEAAVAYARQLAKADSSILERYTRFYNYPPKSCIKTAADLDRLGIKTYFCSNVCAAYKRSVYKELGGFVQHTIFNEDMIYAAGAITRGYAVVYAADARVFHSHKEKLLTLLRRNFDLGVSQAQHPEIFENVPSEKEGTRMVKGATGYLLKRKQYLWILRFYVQCGFKYLGYCLGKRYRRLPRFLIRACTSNAGYWKQSPWE